MILNTPNMYLVLQPIEYMGRDTEYEVLTRIKGMMGAEGVIRSVIEGRREVDFDIEVLNTALDTTPIKMKLAINLLPNTLENLRVPDIMDSIIIGMGKSKSDITFEVSEDTNCESSNVLLNIQRFKNMGYRVALDDFSGRWSDFHLLEAIKPSIVKFDRELVGNSGVTSLVAQLNSSGMDTILEGVESQEDVRKAIEIGYRGLQGYFIGKPLPLKELKFGNGNSLDNMAVNFSYKD